MPADDLLTAKQLRVMAAVLGGCRTVRAVADALGYSSLGYAHVVLRKLRRCGLVSWQDGHCATLQSSCRFGPE